MHDLNNQSYFFHHFNRFTGTTGPVGQSGPPGLMGPKGERAEAGPAPIRQTSAFTVILASSQTGNVGDILLFPTIRSNIGNDFNVATGKFTCRIRGVYLFSFHIMFDDNSGPTRIQLKKDGERIVSVYNDDRDQTYATESNGAILELDVGDEVWLEFVRSSGTVHDNSNNHYTSFSGFLLQEI